MSVLAALILTGGGVVVQPPPTVDADARLRPAVQSERYSDIVVASWYDLHGHTTASGDTFDRHALTAAHPTLPFGTRLLVERDGRSVVVTVNDRGPWIGGRELDLSRAAFARLAPLGAGIIDVRIKVLP